MTPYIRSVHGSGIDLPEGWDLMRWINLSIREQYPGRIAIAEDMQSDPRISQVDDHGAAFHAQWDGAFVHPVREAVIVADDAHRSLERVRDALTVAYNGDPFQRVIYTESHDEVANGRARVPYEVHPEDPTGWYAQKRSTLGAALVLTAPGIPMLFQGQEFLQGEWFRDDVPLDWDLREDFRGIVRLYRDLIRLRRNSSGGTRGLTGRVVDVYHTNEADNVMAYRRWTEPGHEPAVGDDVVVLVNLGATERSDYRIGMPAAGTWSLAFSSDDRRYSRDFTGSPGRDLQAEPVPYDGQPAGATVSIPAYSVLIYAFGAAGGLRSPLQRLLARLFGRLGRSRRRVPLGAGPPD
jgi:1,4-alpha-glucan branching enzyme